MPDPPMQQFLASLLRAAVGKPDDQEAERVKQLTPAEQVSYVMQTIVEVAEPVHRQVSALNAILRRKLPFTPDQILRLVQYGRNPGYYFPFAQILRLAGTIPMTPALLEALRGMREAKVIQNSQVSDSRGLLRTIDELLACRDAGTPFEPAGPWSRQIAPEVTAAWQDVLEAGKSISGSEPSKKWRDAAASRVAAIGREEVKATASRWLALGPSPDTSDVQLDAVESDY